MGTVETDPVEAIKKAFRADDADLVRTLLERHPEIRARIDDPIGPFDSPAITHVRSRRMLDVLIEAGADLNAKSRWWAGGFGLLHEADPELSAYAIQRGAVVDVHAAARLGMLERLQELVAGDPGLVHARGGDGQTPLHFARRIEVAEFLLARGADIDARDVDHESTPAQWMVDQRQEVARFLMARGCRTDLLMASAIGDLDLVSRTLDADPGSIRMRVSEEYFPMIGPKNGGTIYQWTLGFYVSAHGAARRFGRDDVLRLLLERSPPGVRLIDACWTHDEAAIRGLRARHPDIAGQLAAGDRRQVAYAARNNEAAVVRRLLECGFPVDGTAQHQGTALHWAAFHGNLEMTRMLLEFNPALDVRDADHDGTPLGWAIYGSQHGWNCQTGDYAGTVAALLAAGARRPEAIGGSPAVQDVLRRG